MVDMRGILTRVYTRLGLGGVRDSGHYQSSGLEAPVYWIDKDGYWAGKYTPWGTILLNRSRLQDVSDAATEYVFLHEYGHGHMHLVPKLLLLMLRFVTTLLLFTIPVLCGHFIGTALSTPVREWPTIGAAFLLVSAIVLVPYVVVSWLDEGYAELFALSRLGVAEYRDRYRELREASESRKLKQLWVLLTYPQPRFVIWASRYVSL